MVNRTSFMGLTLIDWAKRTDPTGETARLVEDLNRYDPPIPIDPAELAWDMAVLGELVSRVDPLVLFEYSDPAPGEPPLIDWDRKFDAPLLDRLMGKPAAVDDMAVWYERNGWRF